VTSLVCPRLRTCRCDAANPSVPRAVAQYMLSVSETVNIVEPLRFDWLGDAPRACYSLRNAPRKKHPRLQGDRGCSGASSSGSQLDATMFDARRLKNSDTALGYPRRSVYLLARGVWVRDIGAYRYSADVFENRYADALFAAALLDQRIGARDSHGAIERRPIAALRTPPRAARCRRPARMACSSPLCLR